MKNISLDIEDASKFYRLVIYGDITPKEMTGKKTKSLK